MCELEKYQVEPIEFTGCHPVIAEALRNGKSILCNLGDRRVLPDLVIGYKRESNYPYVTRFDAWESAEPVLKKRTEIRVKKASEIVKWLEDNGYNIDTYGDWKPPYVDGTFIYFNHLMFRYCGEKPRENFTWLEEWLEEVEV